MEKIKIVKIELKDIINDNNKGLNKYNNSNNYEEIPEDYKEYIKEFDTKNWIDGLHKYKKIVIEKSEIIWLYDALKLSNLTGEFTKIYEEELDELLSKYEELDGNNYFVRTDKTSLKNGKYGIGPYKNLRNIIISMCTTILGHHAFSINDVEINLYLMEFKEINIDYEFRVFVVDNKISCVSQQNIYKKNEYIDSNNDKELIIKLEEEFNKNIREKLLKFNNYIMDIVYINGNFEFIEINPFGKEYTSGSACFNWITDDETIYDTTFIEFRYVI